MSRFGMPVAVFACLTGGRAAAMRAFLLETDLSLSLLDFLRASLCGCTVESESVRTLVVMGEDECLLAFSLLALPVLGCSFTGLLGATDDAYRSVPSITFPDSSTSATDATIDRRSRPDMAARALARNNGIVAAQRRADGPLRRRQRCLELEAASVRELQSSSGGAMAKRSNALVVHGRRVVVVAINGCFCKGECSNVQMTAAGAGDIAVSDRERFGYGLAAESGWAADQGGNNWDEVSGSRGQKRWRNGTVTSFIPLRGGASNVSGGRDGMGRPARSKGGHCFGSPCKAPGIGRDGDKRSRPRRDRGQAITEMRGTPRETDGRLFSCIDNSRCWRDDTVKANIPEAL